MSPPNVHPDAFHPVALLQLDESDPEYNLVDSQGRSPRFSVEQVDGDKYCFTSRQGAEGFMAIHGMESVSDNDMKKLRAAMPRK